jgi:hypothetical protein
LLRKWAAGDISGRPGRRIAENIPELSRCRPYYQGSADHKQQRGDTDHGIPENCTDGINTSLRIARLTF